MRRRVVTIGESHCPALSCCGAPGSCSPRLPTSGLPLPRSLACRLPLLTPSYPYVHPAALPPYVPQRRSLAASYMSPAESALVSAVLKAGAEAELLPAIMTAYAHADHVVRS